ncbi:hypothetical protein BGZ76_009908 [Entomortierella beljakovae]|nr:hypothetical protein BGZ76_009908 [Entomortierella beljakovae]
MPIALSGHSMSSVQGTDELLIAGGESPPSNKTSPSPILTFQPTGNVGWSSPPLSVNDTASFHRLYHASLTTGKDGAILHGGYYATVANGTVVSTLVTLKASNNFKPLSTVPVALALGAPALARHTMTLTTSGHAVMLGGINSQGIISNMSVAYILNTQTDKDSWKPMQLQGTPPDPRMSFTSVLLNATTILVYGGTADYRSAFTTPYYLDIPTWTWTAQEADGDAPTRWGHTATVVGRSMIVAFGHSPDMEDEDNIAILDTYSNTWTNRFRPVGTKSPSTDDPNGVDGEDGGSGGGGGLSVGAVLGIAFVVTILIVGGAFYLLVRRRKRRTRNTLARENMSDQTPRSALKRQTTNKSEGFFGSLSSLFSAGSKSTSTPKRYSEMPMYSNPLTVSARMAQMGYSPVSLGYPETVVQHGCGQVSVSSYIYPNQACVVTEKESDGQETLVVYHMLTQAQQEALKLSSQPAHNKNKLKHMD